MTLRPFENLRVAENPPNGEPRRRMRGAEFLIEWGLFGCALLSIGTTIGIIVILTVETAGFLKEVPISEFLFGTEWTPLYGPGSR